MWPMIAEPGLRCAECRHNILPGRLCLSEAPEETPGGVSRGDFRNYCIGCPQCWAQGKHACYVRHLDGGGRNTGKAPRSLPCARCGRRIGAGEKAGMDIYYDWPGQAAEERERGGALTKSGIAGLAAAAQVGTILRSIPDGGFASLSDSLQRKFMDAGLRPEHGVRSAAEAQALYQESVPGFVRNYGEDAVRQFLQGKDASHIQSVHNAPQLATDSGNILWESSGINRARGAADMTGWEQFAARGSNAFDAAGIVMRECATAAGTSALIAGLLETPVAAVENYIRYRKGAATGEQAVKDAARSIIQHAGAGAIGGVAVTIAIVFAGPIIGPIIATVAPILMPVGLALYGISALKRILNALDDGLPLHRVGTYFCSPRCHTRFAYETGKSALVRWENNRMATATA